MPKLGIFNAAVMSFKAILKNKILMKFFFVWFDSLRSSQQFFSYVLTGLPGLNQ